MRHAKLGRRDVGAAMVEFALVLPLMFLVIGGVVDFGRMLFTEVTLTNAAREGARAAVVSTATLANIQSRAQAASPGLTVTAAASPPGTPCATPGGNATISVSAPFTWFILAPISGVAGLPSTLTSTAVMKCGG